MKKRLNCIYLEILSIPTILMSKKKSAIYHLKNICPKCPDWRRKLRATNKKDCFWFNKWKAKDYSISRSMGLKNKISQILFLKTNLKNSKQIKKTK